MVITAPKLIAVAAVVPVVVEVVRLKVPSLHHQFVAVIKLLAFAVTAAAIVPAVSQFPPYLAGQVHLLSLSVDPVTPAP